MWLLCPQRGQTAYISLLAVFVSLLNRYTGQEEIVVGLPIANRNRKELEPLIGFFVNTLVLRVDLSNDPSFEQLLGQVRRLALEAYEHQANSFPVKQFSSFLNVARSLSLGEKLLNHSRRTRRFIFING
ncbi:MAG: hypothetical protein F6J99_27185 [Moorea sp. SIO4G3]|nr:hypothetical protein [Moorena sp. SIO4G3]